MLLAILAGVGFLAGLAGCLAANLTIAAIVDDVNRGRPLREQVNALGWYPGKLARVLAAYRAAYPAGPQLRRLRWAEVAMG